MIKIHFETSSAAFNDDEGNQNSFYRNIETIRILEDLVKKMKNDPEQVFESRSIFDINGNIIGTFEYEAD